MRSTVEARVLFPREHIVDNNVKLKQMEQKDRMYLGTVETMVDKKSNRRDKYSRWRRTVKVYLQAVMEMSYTPR